MARDAKGRFTRRPYDRRIDDGVAHRIWLDEQRRAAELRQVQRWADSAVPVGRTAPEPGAIDWGMVAWACATGVIFTLVFVLLDCLAAR